MKKRSFSIILRLMADIFYAYSFTLLLPAAIGLLRGERALVLVFLGEAAVLLGGSGWLKRRTSTEGVRSRHAAIALVLTWITLALLAGVPFWVWGMAGIDALFEAFSAWTDTGLTMLPDPAVLPYSLSFFRVMMQWISGLGIVMFMLFLRRPAPRAAQSLFQAEGRFEDFTTDLWHVGHTIVWIYAGYTLLGAVSLCGLGVPPYDALLHAITSLSTGGFSTNSVGVGGYGAGPALVAMGLMLAGGISFGSHQALLSGKVRKFLRNPEVRALFLLIVAALGTLSLAQVMRGEAANAHLLDNAFYTITAITSCGAGTTLPLTDVSDVFLFVLLLLMLSGAVYGSTTGGLKLWRLLILGQVIRREAKRPFFPEGTVMPLRMGHNVISESTALQVAGYVLLYLTLGLLGSLIFMLYGYRPLYALFTVFSAQGNVGLNAMPADLYYGMPVVLKAQLIFHMLVGRVEIYPLLYLFHELHS